jgi:hypothetical protein
MNRKEQESFLREILGDEALKQARAIALERGLAAVRVRRRRKTVAVTLGAVMIVAAFLTTVWQRQPATYAPQPSAPSVQLKIITDEQLIALFPNRPTALVGAPGEQQLLFLDAPSARTR